MDLFVKQGPCCFLFYVFGFIFQKGLKVSGEVGKENVKRLIVLQFGEGFL